ncbi:MAG: membrane protein insertase YidC [Bacteroidota bacterium]|nr:membrane protein insertase YidC [Bacteroidota bacterium]
MNSVERNQAIGLVLISAMLIAYFTFFSDLGKTETPSIKKESKSVQNIPQSEEQQKIDTLALKKALGDFSTLGTGKEQTNVLENDLIKVTLSSKGAQVQSVILKKFQSYKKQNLELVSTSTNQYTLTANTKNGFVRLSDLYANEILKSDTSITYSFKLSDNQYFNQTFSIRPKTYELNCRIYSVGLDQLLTDSKLTYSYVYNAPLIEKDLASSRQTANVTYRLMDGTFKSLSETSTDPQEQNIETKANWVTLKQKFFSIGLISQSGFVSGKVSSKIDPTDTNIVKTLSATLVYPLDGGKGNLTYYFGPNKLNIVNKVAPDFVENVYLGWPVINTINRYTIAPLFEFLEKLNINYGLIIILMVLIIKLVLFPLSYNAYHSMAKIKVLKPEMDEIKARVGDDMGAMQQEQMKLYNQVGVNPLSGCIPVLLQMPVLLAMFNFFPNAIELRQQPFLWAEDLSTYDSIATLPFKIPFYGDHVSMFALLMTASTILYTWYNSQMNVSVTGPMMAMQYIMPLIFMFILNSMPAGLSFYYFVSNMVTIGQQFIIKLFVDEGAIRAKLDENKKNQGTKKPNRFQQRLMSAMEQQQELKKKQANSKK